MGRLILERGIKTIPEKPKLDDRGILMQMVYTE
jgi:predicted RNase H-like nuclease